MGVLAMFKRKPRERRNYTQQMIDAHYAAVTGQSGIAELTATAQTCVGLWEAGFTIADVDGTDALPPGTLALLARQLALTGEAVFLIGDRLVPAAQWSLNTRDGIPTAYRVALPDIAGGRSVTALAGEVLHFRIGCTANAPWCGSPPLQRASLTAGLLCALESALSDVFNNAPLGSQVVPMPEDPNISNEKLAQSFRGQRGRVLLRESTQVTAAGGPAPQTDWRPSDLTPDLSQSGANESWQGTRAAIMAAFGVLPALLDAQAAGPTIREGQRHLAQWTLQPIAELIAQEASDKLGSTITLDVMRATQAYDAGGRARALAGAIEAMAAAKQAGLTPGDVAAAMKFSGIADTL